MQQEVAKSDHRSEPDFNLSLWLYNECDACTCDYEVMIVKVVSHDYIISMMVMTDVAHSAE